MKNIWTVVGIVAIVILVLALCMGGVMLLAIGRGASMMGRYGGFGMMTGFHLGWIIPLGIALVLIIAIITAVVWFVRKNEKPGEQAATAVAPTTESPIDILKARYAKGEITKEQFDAMKQDLA